MESLEFRYDTQLLIEGTDLDEDEINDYFTENFKGDCLLAVGDEELIKIHFHTNEPWKVLEYCSTLGENFQELVVLVVHLGVNRVHSRFIDPYQPAAVLAGFFIVWNFLYNIAVVNISVLNSKFLLADILMVILVNLAR